MKLLHRERKGMLMEDQGVIFVTKKGKLMDVKQSKRYLRRPHIKQKLEKTFGNPISLRYFIDKKVKRRWA